MSIELELLAPAKNKSIGITAIDCGADAVYIAGPKFGARESAGNAIEDIAELVDYAHKFGAKVYMVVNTIIYEQELEDVKSVIWEAYKIGCDAIIVQDLSLLKMDLPPIKLFASTQTNIRDVEQAKLLESLGFKRLILARELSLKQIKEIKNSVNVDVETFIHGALCVSYSGQCYLSQKLTKRSANRGACAQPCRSNYDLVDENGKVIVKNRSLLSLKDLNLSDRVEDLVKAGVTSFKIEGRLKNDSYIKNIVLHYRRELDRIISNNKEYCRASWGSIEKGFISDPNLTFNRGYTELFINEKRGKWLSEDGAKYLGEYIGNVEKSSVQSGGATNFIYKSKLKQRRVVNGDGLCFVTPKGDIIGARANSCEGSKINLLERLNIPIGSKIYRNFNVAFEKELQNSMPERLIYVDLTFMRDGDNCSILVNCVEGIDFKYNIEFPIQEAANLELAKKSMEAQLSKRVERFSFRFREFKGESTPFYPTSVLNGIRRDIASLLSQRLEEMRKKSAEQEQNLCEVSEDRSDVNREEIVEDKRLINKNLTYLANASNDFSKQVYKELGYREISSAYELVPVSRAELMRTKYCLKYEFGFCPKEGSNFNKKLYLVNGNNKLELLFDCSKCEMLIIG